jgi:hypothetical protein
LVAPIALYPDPLVSQILVASTYPLELVQALQWLQRSPGLAGAALTQAAEQQNWDPSIQALVVFPDLVKRLNQEVAFTVGTQGWPFPVLVIREDGRWRLDSASGRIEIFARRIGRNELNVMEVCRGYAEAQIEYAAGARDGDRVLKYAQKVVSAPGKQDGLYWDGKFDSLVPRAFAEAAVASPSTVGKSPEPYHGYYFRVSEISGAGRQRRRLRLCGHRKDDRRLRSGRLARGVWRVGNPDFHDQSRWSGVRRRRSKPAR